MLGRRLIKRNILFTSPQRFAAGCSTSTCTSDAEAGGVPSSPAVVRISNSLRGGSNVLSLAPSRPSSLSWYSCGPTVYDSAHLGHARTYICTDIIRRVLQEVLQVNVDFAMGITDIDNKIIDRAITKGISAKELASRYEKEFLDDMEVLNVQMPNVLLRVTEHVPEIIEYISTIIKNGNAYVKPHGVYFAVHKVSGSYGKLGRVTEAPVAEGGAAPEGEEAAGVIDKVDKRDFALWKVTDSEPCWDSPWGRGRPGWHIECSAMTHAYFGPEVDVHSGGIDLEFPHHTNEIAQCEAHNCQDQWVRYWLHTGHLHIDGRKMSKSLKNFISIKDYFAFGWTNSPANDLRIYFLHHKYHSTLHFSQERIVEASNFRQKVELLQKYTDELRKQLDNRSKKPTAASKDIRDKLYICRGAVTEALRDDFDTPSAMRVLSQLLGATLPLAHEAMVDRSIAAEPILASSDYIIDTLETFGLRIRHTVSESPASTHSAAPDEKLVSSFVQFRGVVRERAIKEMKSIKDTLKAQAPTDSVHHMGKTQSEAWKSILSACDSARTQLQNDHGIYVNDSSAKSVPGNSQIEAAAPVMWTYRPTDKKNT